MPDKSKAQTSANDIRAFFGNGSAKASQKPSQKSSAGKSSSKPIAIDDSDDDKPKKAGSSSKPTVAPIPKKKPNPVLLSEGSEEEAPPPKKTSVSATTSKHFPTSTSKKVGPRPSETSTQKRPIPASKKKVVLSEEEEEPSDQDPFEPDSSGDDKPVVKKKASAAPVKPRASTSTAKASSSKRRHNESEEESAESTSEDEKPKKKKPRPSTNAKAQANGTAPSKATPSTKAPPKAKAVADGKSKDTTKDTDDKPKKKWIPPAAKGPPPAAGSKDIPNGDPNALAGLAFVFTGELSAFSRDEIIDLAKRYGGRVTTAPSRKTDYVVLGSEAGPKKLADIKRLEIKTLDEDGFLALIGSRKGKLDAKQLEKQEKEQKKLEADAKALAKADKAAKANGVETSSQLWTTKYSPESMKDVVGNKANAEKIQKWLEDWSSSLKSGFKKPGPNGMNVYRALLITGPPGIGKTTSAHLAAKLTGFTPIELNASDARSKRLVESSTNISNTSLDGWMAGGSESTTVAGIKVTDRTVLVMDEVDGMSAGDRGGVGALSALVKKTHIPIICIANDKRAIKLKPLQSVCFNMSFTKPAVNQVRARMMTIALREKIKLEANVMDQLIEGANSDIRQVLNMLSTWKLSNASMDFDEGKRLARANEKHVILTPYTIIEKILGPYAFAKTSRESLADKMDYYFHDHSFVPLFVQENYLRPTPSKLKGLVGPEADMKHLELMEKASRSVSDGDLVDAAIHQGQQWGLMPLHAIHSTVRPSYYMHGMGLGFAGKDATRFPSWLGQNSKQGKISRQLGEVQIRMRLKVSGDRSEIRQSYIPALFNHVVLPLMEKDSVSEVDDVISKMDDYYLSKDDWDTIVEVGVGEFAEDAILKKVPTATKSALTRKYNSSEHPVPFHKAADVGSKPVKKIAKGEAPDQEDVYDNEDDEVPPDDAAGGDESDNDISKDKLIKAKDKGKGAAKSSKNGGGTSAGTKGTAKGTAAKGGAKGKK